jgi:hypothetical protein
MAAADPHPVVRIALMNLWSCRKLPVSFSTKLMTLTFSVHKVQSCPNLTDHSRKVRCPIGLAIGSGS